MATLLELQHYEITELFSQEALPKRCHFQQKPLKPHIVQIESALHHISTQAPSKCFTPKEYLS